MSAPDVDADRILAEACALSFPRYPGSEGDRRAIAWVADKLRSAGLDTVVEPFSYDLRPAEWALRALLGGGALLIAAAVVVGRESPLVAIAFVVAPLVPSLAFLTWAPQLERLYRREGHRETANVIGRRRAPEPLLTLLLMAHHDSKSQSLSLPFRAGLTLTAIVGAAGLVATLIGGLATQQGSGPAWLASLSGGAAVLSLSALASLRSGDRSPGAVDNAGSVAVLLELARTLPRDLSPEVELVVLVTGAEEDHMVGAMRWLDAHLDEHLGRPLLCLNLDGVGAPGRLVLLDRYGLGRPFSPRLTRLAVTAAARLGLRVRRVLTPPGMGIDTIPFVHAGVETLTLSSGSLGPATLAIHSARDVPEHLDRDTLERATRLVREVTLDAARRPEEKVGRADLAT